LKFGALSFQQIKSLIQAREISCDELVRHYLDNIQQQSGLNAFITVDTTTARTQSQLIDQKIQKGNAGSLAGCVLAIKDNICVRDYRTTCGSKILANFIPPYDATVVRRLKAADAILIGKTNLDEFGMGSSTENSYFGAVQNPYDRTRVPGGSSGGSAVAVAANLCTASLGTDTGGSIRQPAAFCGVVGLKPTYGRVSRYGLVAFASSLDQIGIIVRSAPDAADLLQVMGGHDPLDATSAALPVPDFNPDQARAIRGVKIGLPKEYFTAGLNPEIKAACDATIALLTQNGAIVEECSLPHTEYAIATYYIIATAEAASNLARYDGSRYGYRAGDTTGLDEMYRKTRSQGFGTEVKRRIMLGTYVLSAGYYDAYYLKAQKVRTLIRQDFEKVFQSFDCILTPTTPTTAFRLNEKLADPLQMYLSDIYTVSVNLAGLPAISVPIGRDQQQLPIGLQLVASAFDEARLLQLACFLENNQPAAFNFLSR
jgi:aspartyl-tRNA(Asn)/glutamyl-tRNA(Gln) amidotransferase subunit A